MEKLRLLIICALFIFAAGCEKDSMDDQDPGVSQEIIDLYEAYQALVEAKDIMIQIGDSLDISPQEAIKQVADRMKNWPEIDEANAVYTHLFIKTNTGHDVSLFLNDLDSSGYSIYRGSPIGQGQLAEFSNREDCENEVANKNVLVYAPDVDDFYYKNMAGLQTAVVDRITNGTVNDMIVDVCVGANCGIEKLRTFNNYGLVIIEAHGKPYGFNTGIEFNLTLFNGFVSVMDFVPEMIDQIGQENFDLLVSKHLTLSVGAAVDPNYNFHDLYEVYRNNDLLIEGKLYCNAKGIRDIIPSLPNTIVFSNSCYSGWQETSYIDPDSRINLTIDPIQPAWMGKGPVAYYGYEARDLPISYAVSDNISEYYDENFLEALFHDKDCTGNAHLSSISEWPYIAGFQWVKNHGPLLFKHYGADDYGYGDCGSGSSPAVTATILGLPSGGSFVATSTNLSYRDGDVVNLQAQQGNRLLNLSTQVFDGVRTYSIGGPNADWQAFYKPTILESFNAVDAAQGIMTVTSDCETSIEGLFNFSAQNSAGSQIELSGEFVIFYD